MITPAGIAVDETSGDLYITGQFNGTSTWHGIPPANYSMSSTGLGNLFIARLNSNGYVTNVTNYAVAGSYGYRLAAPNGQNGEVYIEGWVYAGGGYGAYTWKYSMPPLPSAPSMPWSVSGTNSTGYGVCLDNSNVYITGVAGPSGTITIGSLSFPGGNYPGAFVASISRSTGAVNCWGIRNPSGGLAAYAMAQDNFTGNLYVAGTGTINGTTGFVQEFSPDYCNYSNRLSGVNPSEEAPSLQSINSENINLVISPNPTTGFCTIASNREIANPLLEVFDIMGNCVYKKQFVSLEKEEIDISNLSSGVYSLRISNGSDINETHKLIKQ
jgi:hypothetical protein